MLRRLAAVAALLAAVVAPSARADVPEASCAGITATGDTFASPGLASGSWLENMGFDGHGGMWVSELFANQLVHFDASGTAGRSLGVASPGASLPRPDGRMFALFGDSTTGVLAPGAAGAVTFDPSADPPVSTPFAGGFNMANGAALDDKGNLYIADSTGSGVIKIAPDGTEDKAFRAAAPIPSGDGLAIIGNTLYVTELLSGDSAIDAVPLGNPAAYKELTSLSPDRPTLLLDDLDVGPDAQLYVASNLGQIIRVNPQGGAACIVYSDAAPFNSVRFAKAFPPFGPRDFFVTSELGTITHVKLSGPGLKRPAITLQARPDRVRRGRLRALRFRVTSPAPCRQGVRVAGVASDARGHVDIRRRLHRTRVFVARKPGCLPGRVSIRVHS